MFKNKLFWKIFVSYISLFCLCLAFTGYFAARVVKKHYLDLLTNNLESHTISISQLIKTTLSKNDTEETLNICKMLSKHSNMGIIVSDQAGSIISQSGITGPLRSYMKENSTNILQKDTLNNIYHDKRSGLIYSVSPVKVNKEKEFLVGVSASLKTHERSLAAIIKTISLSMLVAFAVTLIVSFVIIKVNTAPLSKITRIAQHIARGDFGRKAEITSSDEIGDLANAINAIGVELQSQMQTILDDKNKLDAIMAHMNNALISTDMQEKIVIINQAAKALFGISTVTVNKDYLWERVRNEKLCSSVREVMKTQISRTLEIELTTSEKKLLQAHLSPVQIDTTTRGILILFHDITELRRLENARKEFVANVSHELRTPLASIKGYLETLLDNTTIDREQSQEFLGIMMKHTQRLDNLIKDILDLSKLDSHDLTIELHNMDIRPFLESISSRYNEHCVQKDQTFELSIPHNIPMIETNEYTLCQLLTNLLDNAVKYTPRNGRIGLKVEFINESIIFEVSDTGIGIPKEHIPRIFERFYRVDSARSREMGGTGLGLSIVKHIVNLHHGFIHVESTPGVGSKFIITLPKQQAKHVI